MLKAPLSIFLIPLLNLTVVRFLLFEKALAQSVFTVAGISILIKDGQLLKLSTSSNVEENSISSIKGKSYNNETFLMPSANTIFLVVF